MSIDDRDPLDAGERDLARRMRALPAGEPPSALDARILAMARDAVVAQPMQADEASPRRAYPRPRWMWGLGTAATMVLAAGLVWRLGGTDPAVMDAAAPAASAPAVASSPVVAPMRRSEPPSAGAPTADRSAAPSALAEESVAAQHAQASSSAERRRMETSASKVENDAIGMAADAESSIEPQVVAETAVEATVEAPLPPPPAAPPAPPAPPPPMARQAIVLSGTPAPEVALAAERDATFARIREKVGRGDVAGARADLDAFVARHPETALPPDLAALRDAAGDE